MATNDDEATTFGEDDLISLGEKLAALDLTEPERAALSELLSDDDVAGFGRFNIAAGIRGGIRGVRNVRVPIEVPTVGGVRFNAGDVGGLGKPKPGPL